MISNFFGCSRADDSQVQYVWAWNETLNKMTSGITVNGIILRLC